MYLKGRRRNELTDIAQPMFDLTLQEDRFDKLDVLFIIRVHAVSHMFSSQRLKAEKCDIKSLETICAYVEEANIGE